MRRKIYDLRSNVLVNILKSTRVDASPRGPDRALSALPRTRRRRNLSDGGARRLKVKPQRYLNASSTRAHHKLHYRAVSLAHHISL